MDNMKWQIQSWPEPCVVTISGDVDVTSAEALAGIQKELAPSSRVVVDVADLEYADTSFLRFLLHLKKHENKSERDAIRLVHVSRRLRRLLEITGLSRVFACEDTVPHAALART
jgi:anti-sigma B factor antagonist